jgi:hypothetical protein
MTREREQATTAAGQGTWTRRPEPQARPLWGAGGASDPAREGPGAPPRGDENQPVRQRPLQKLRRPAAAAPSVLETDFPSVIGLLMRVWGTAAGTEAFRRLVLDQRGGVRSWPAEAWEELNLLRRVHEIRLALEDRTRPKAFGGVHTPDGDEREQRSVLETRYQHVLKRIVHCWGSPGPFAEIFDDLIIDRRGDRQGWPPDAWAELMLLQQVHLSAYGRVDRPSDDHHEVFELFGLNVATGRS